MEHSSCVPAGSGMHCTAAVGNASVMHRRCASQTLQLNAHRPKHTQLTPPPATSHTLQMLRAHLTQQGLKAHLVSTPACMPLCLPLCTC
mmetsp:Transcript_6760/g.18134  ORF Transcript_6760/g.18134 Transcript_6760/m.18134 type:complete len:89 (+) Transcript_6760:1122-1388(+)